MPHLLPPVSGPTRRRPLVHPQMTEVIGINDLSLVLRRCYRLELRLVTLWGIKQPSVSKTLQ